MDSFSVISLTSLCTAISHRLIGSAEELNDFLARLDTQHDAIAQLYVFAETLQQLKQTTSELEASLNGATAISTRLQTHMSQSLGACDGTTAAVNKQVMRLQPDALDRLDDMFLIVYTDVTTAYDRLFSLFSTLLALADREEQDASLDSSTAKETIEHAELAALQASQIREILVDGKREDSHGSASKPSTADGAPQTPAGNEEPPPYEPESIRPPPVLRSGSSSFSKGISSLSKSFRAFASGFGSKPDPLVSVLCQAALRGDIQQMKGLFSQGANVNGRNEEGNTPLACSILAKQDEATRFLLNAGADHSSSGAPKLPPLFLAASLGSTDIARLLLDKGANVQAKGLSGQSFFVDVVASGDMDGIRLLLERGAPATASTLSGKPIIADAVKKGNIELVKLLLKHGANATTASDLTGNSILAVAVNNDDLPMVQLLLEHSAKASCRTYTGNPVVTECINKQRLKMARMLIESGADPNARDPYGHPVIVSLIRHPKISQEDKIDLSRMLLQRGATPEVSDGTWGTALICHVMALGNSELVELLLNHGAKPNKKMSSGETLLLYAIDHGRRDQVKMLLEHGADPNVLDKKNRSSLMQALNKQDVELLRMLRQHGADTSVEAWVSASELAGSLNRPEIVEALEVVPRSPSISQYGSNACELPIGPEARPVRRKPPPPGY